MLFPGKKTPKQRLTGYVRDVLPIIEREFKSGVLLSEIHEALIRDSGFACSFSYFTNVLFLVRKEGAVEPQKEQLVNKGDSPNGIEKEQAAGRSFVWKAPDGPAALDEIFKKGK